MLKEIWVPGAVWAPLGPGSRLSARLEGLYPWGLEDLLGKAQGVPPFTLQE